MASLIDCQFCGVSFELARVRQPHEPQKLAWDYSGDGYVSGDDDDCTGHLCEWVEHPGRNMEGTGYPNRPARREHLAGADCTLNWGYSGARILAEEMKGFRYVQCLMPKTRNWQPNEDDKDYERDSNHFLSGILHCPDPEMPERYYVESSGQRHGVDPLFLDNYNRNQTDLDKLIEFNGDAEGDCRDAIPFHPECFQIFTRISNLRLGRVNLNGLKSWRNSFQSFNHFHKSWPSDLAAREARSGGSWEHQPGSEYLAANPLNVPGLFGTLSTLSKDYKVLLRRKGKNENGQIIDPSNNDNYEEDVIPSRDLNETLSWDIQDKLRKCSTPREFENLMNTSSELSGMDRGSWRQLLFKEMPWLWEVEDLEFAITDFKILYIRAKYSLCATFKGLYNRKRIWEDMEIICGYIVSQITG